MGIGAGLGSLLAAGVGAYSAHKTQSANAAAQSSINKATMEFNAAEALKAREFEHQEAEINRLFNQRSANTAMDFSSNEAKIQRAWEHSEALKARQFESSEAAAARQFESGEAAIARNFNAAEALKQRNWSSSEAKVARNFDAQQSLLAREFEERMSNTAHQREVADLRAAGLNPVLSATGGSGASSPVAPVIGAPLPSGGAASAQAAHGHKANGVKGSGSSGSGFSASGTSAKAIAASVSGLNAYMKKDVLGQFINTAMDGMRLDNDIKRAKAADIQAQASMKNAETNEYSARWDAYIKNEGLGISRQKAAAEIDKLEADIELMHERLEIDKSVANATIEEKLAAAEKFKSGVLVDNQQAALLGLNKEDLEGRLMYGNLLMQYLPRGLRNEVMNHFVEYVKDNKEAIYDFADSLKAHDFKSVDIPKLEFNANLVQDWLKEKGFIPSVRRLSWDEATKNLIGGS